MATIRAVVFDLGHTLWDFAPREESHRLSVLRLHAVLRAALDAKTPSPAALDRALGAAVARWFESWNSDRLEQPPSERLVSEALGTLDLAPPDDLLHELTRVFFGVEVEMPVIEPDSLAAIARLDEAGLVMGCVTNTITLEDGILDALSRLGMLRYFRSVVASSAMSYRKPHPSLFLHALRELDVAPEEAVFVGDRLVDDVGGARGVGMRAVLTHQYRQEPLDGVREGRKAPDAIIRRLSELPETLERMEASGEANTPA